MLDAQNRDEQQPEQQGTRDRDNGYSAVRPTPLVVRGRRYQRSQRHDVAQPRDHGDVDRADDDDAEGAEGLRSRAERWALGARVGALGSGWRDGE